MICAEKTPVISNWSDLFGSLLRVGVLYFAKVSSTFVVYLVTNSKSNAWGVFFWYLLFSAGCLLFFGRLQNPVLLVLSSKNGRFRRFSKP